MALLRWVVYTSLLVLCATVMVMVLIAVLIWFPVGIILKQVTR
jgi:hypothetical protein